MKKFKLIFVLPLICFLCGCLTSRAHYNPAKVTTYGDIANFVNRKTFMVINHYDPACLNHLKNQEILEPLFTELCKRGYIPFDSPDGVGYPDFVVAAEYSIEQSTTYRPPFVIPIPQYEPGQSMRTIGHIYTPTTGFGSNTAHIDTYSYSPGRWTTQPLAIPGGYRVKDILVIRIYAYEYRGTTEKLKLLWTGIGSHPRRLNHYDTFEIEIQRVLSKLISQNLLPGPNYVKEQ